MLLTTAGLLITTSLALIWWLLKPSKRQRMIDKIPGPTAIPILGNALQLKADPFAFFKQIQDFSYEYEKSAPVFKLQIGTETYVFLYTAEAAERFLGSMKHLTKANGYRFMFPWIQTGLLTSTGEKWHLRRKLLTPTFHFRILNDFLGVFNEQAQILVSVLQQKCEECGDAEAFDIFPHITLCALDIICETAMGKKMNAQTTGSNSDYVEAVYTMSDLVIKRARSPWQWSDWIYNLMPSGKKHAASLKTLHSFTRKVIEERIEELADPSSEPQQEIDGEDSLRMNSKRRMAFLDLLIHMSKEADFTRNDIQEEVDTFMFEGHDTTAAGMAFAIYLIGSYPEVKQRLQQEMTQIFGDSKRAATMADISNMKYLECVIKESLRIYPSVVWVAREVEEDTQLGELVIPKGVSLNVFLWKINRDPACFEDPEKFDPDRFTKENSTVRHPYAFIPFSAGPRNCIGQKFALIEEKCVLSTILRNFDITSTQTPEEVKPVPELILRPLNGIKIKLKQRSL